MIKPVFKILYAHKYIITLFVTLKVLIKLYTMFFCLAVMVVVSLVLHSDSLKLLKKLAARLKQP